MGQKKKHKRIFIPVSTVSKQLTSEEAVEHDVNVLSGSAHVSHKENKDVFNMKIFEGNL